MYVHTYICMYIQSPNAASYCSHGHRPECHSMNWYPEPQNPSHRWTSLWTKEFRDGPTKCCASNCPLKPRFHKVPIAFDTSCFTIIQWAELLMLVGWGWQRNALRVLDGKLSESPPKERKREKTLNGHCCPSHQVSSIVITWSFFRQSYRYFLSPVFFYWQRMNNSPQQHGSVTTFVYVF